MSTALMHGFGGLNAPFPGLRAFEAEESLLFYGREAPRRRAARPARRQPFRRRHRHVGLRQVLARAEPVFARRCIADTWSMPRRAGVSRRCGRAARRFEALADALAGALGSEPLECDHAARCSRPAPGCRRSSPRRGSAMARACSSSPTSSRSCSASTSRAAQQGRRRAVRQPSARSDRTPRRADLRRRDDAFGISGPLLGVHRARRGVQPQPVPRAAADARRAPRGDRAAAAAVRHRA